MKFRTMLLSEIFAALLTVAGCGVFMSDTNGNILDHPYLRLNAVQIVKRPSKTVDILNTEFLFNEHSFFKSV